MTTTNRRTPMREDDETPYDELDPPIVNVCRAINALPGIWTVGSCSGHQQNEEWMVNVKCDVEDDLRPSMVGWLSLEFLAWAVYDAGRTGPVRMEATSAPPWVNEPTRTIFFDIFGVRDDPNSITPDAFAEFLTKQTAELCLPPPGDEIYGGDHP
jgi:hypothetical protein